MTSEREDEFENLMMGWELGQLSGSDIEKLQTLLKSDESARKRFAKWQNLSVALKLESMHFLPPESASEESLPAAVKRANPKTHTDDKRIRWSNIGVAALSMSILAFAGWLFFLQFPGPGSQQASENDKPPIQNPDAEKTSQGVAIITKLVDVLWLKEESRQDVGDAITSGPWAIQSGFAQIEFFSGATIVLEGPAEIEFVSSSFAKVKSGKIRANVPEVAHGFTLEIDGIKVVDLGTEFGVEVTDGKTDVQVFDGEVEIHYPSKPKQTLTAGDAIYRSDNGPFQKSNSTPNSFVDIPGLAKRESSQTKSRADRWKVWSDKIRIDPRVIAYYSFEDEIASSRSLPCVSDNSLFDQEGAIIGARQVNGRWNSKKGLEFKRPGDRVRMNIAGEFDSLTFSAWVKIDSLDRMYNSLLLTDNYNQGEPHWQILDTGQLFFSVRWKPDRKGNEPPLSGPTHHTIISAPFWEPSMSGKWIHLATTYNATDGSTSHFLNGKNIHTEKVPPSLLVEKTRIGEATLGNWSIPTKPDEKFAIRNLNGTIDELLIMNVSLTEPEIANIYQQGKP